MLAAVAKEVGLRRLDITEVDTQESTINPPEGSFVSTWSCAALHDEVSQTEAVVALGDKVKQLGSCAIDTCTTSVNGAPENPMAFRGHIVSHEECFSLRRLFGGSSLVQIQFVYQPSLQMRNSLYAARNSRNLPFDKVMKTLGEEAEPDGYDSVGALAVTEKGHMQWCGLCLRAKDAWVAVSGDKQASKTANATSWLTAAGVLLAVQICIDHPNIGAVFAEDLPLSILEPALEEGLIPPFISKPVDSEFAQLGITEF